MYRLAHWSELLQPLMLGDTAVKNPELVPPTKVAESMVKVQDS
jgi:hypothetical protein